MKIYSSNKAKEKKLVKPVRKNHSAWKIGRWIVLLVIAWITISVTKNTIEGMKVVNEVRDPSMIYMYIIFTETLSVALLGVTYAIAASGGRDILLARIEDKVYLDEKQLVNVFTPKYKQVARADYVELKMPYENFKSLVWNSKLFRLEIEGERTMISINGGRKVETPIYKGKLILYDIYDNMEELVKELERKSNVILEERKRK